MGVIISVYCLVLNLAEGCVSVSGEKNKEEAQKKGSFIGRMFRDFFLGCMAFLPLAVFAFIFYYIVMFLKALGGMIFGITDSVATTAVISAVSIAALVYAGRKLRRHEKWLFSLVELGISKLPLVGGWYVTIRDMVQAFTAGGGERGYLGTASVPCGAGYIIGFVTNRETREDGSVLVTIFVPTSPNPTTGLVFFFPESEVTYLDMTPEAAFTKIISLGMKS